VLTSPIEKRKRLPTSTKRTAPDTQAATIISAAFRRGLAFPTDCAYFPTFAKIAFFGVRRPQKFVWSGHAVDRSCAERRGAQKWRHVTAERKPRVHRPPPSISAAVAAEFRARAHELDALHRRRGSIMLHGGIPSWVLQWLRALMPSSLGGPALLPRRPPPPIPMPAAGECAITFIGHSTALIRFAHARLLTDPCLARSLYSLRRVRAPGLPDGALESVDVVLISHAHADHLHRPSLELLERKTTLVVPAGVRTHKLGFQNIVELRAGDTTSVAGLDITAVPAQHRVGFLGHGRALGYVVRGDGPTLYFSGDTGYFSGFLEVGSRFRPDVALLPISGYRPRALRQDHLSPLDALYAFEDLGAELLVPIHHGAFALGYEPVAEPLVWLRSLASARHDEERIAWLEPGESCVARRAPLQTHPPSDM
jgi:L-ascorbate metabolism protein UlaG (beta-lactamase superfamily)